jgi:hypothetical protein
MDPPIWADDIMSLTWVIFLWPVNYKKLNSMIFSHWVLDLSSYIYIHIYIYITYIPIPMEFLKGLVFFHHPIDPDPFH